MPAIETAGAAEGLGRELSVDPGVSDAKEVVQLKEGAEGGLGVIEAALL